MGKCLFCESATNEYWFGNFCESCRKIKNLANVYGFDRVLTILEKCCIRDSTQLENKIKNHKETIPLKTIPEDVKEELTKSNELYTKVSTRSNKK
tara:strand:- start:499 stop:783 length:285 start_codon:yes stop_codon:yes gene_type:complete